jgi:hypothetical protein
MHWASVAVSTLRTSVDEVSRVLHRQNRASGELRNKDFPHDSDETQRQLAHAHLCHRSLKDTIKLQYALGQEQMDLVAAHASQECLAAAPL